MRNVADKVGVLVGCVTVVASAWGGSAGSGAAFVVSNNVPAVANFKQPTNLAELLAVPLTNLDKVDVGLIDLLCAEGLRGSEDLDVGFCVRTLNTWAYYVESETRRNQHLFDEHPERFKNSLAYYRMALLATVLCQDLRIRYNPVREQQLEKGHTLRTDKDEAEFFGNASDLFIHGLLTGKHYGTCASLPYLYVAIGRRLGYPVTLATTADHFYVRYEEANGKHLNVEATENRAFLTPSDEEYKNPWELHVSDEEAEGLHYFQPLSNQEILGHTLLTRSAVLKSMGQYDKQAETWAIAARYLPDTPMWKTFEHDMQELAKNTAWQETRKAMWNRVAQFYIPPGPGYGYFQNQKAQLHFLMNYTLDTAGIEKAVARFENELGTYVKPFIESGGFTNQLLAPPGQQLVLGYSTVSGKVIIIPADFLPPFQGGFIPPDLVQRIDDKKLEDSESILAEFWSFYDEIAQARNRAGLRRIIENGTGQILIARENAPQDYWDAIPEELQVRLNGLNDEGKIIQEMWAFHAEEAARREDAARIEKIFLYQKYHVPYGKEPVVNVPSYLVPAEYQQSMPLELKFRLAGKASVPEILTEISRFQLEERNRHAFDEADKFLYQARAASAPPSRILLVPASVLNRGATPDAGPSFPFTASPQPQMIPSNKSKGNP